MLTVVKGKGNHQGSKISCFVLQLPILGNSLQLLGCAWEVMIGWVLARRSIVRVKIFNMDFVLVGSAEGVKRVFQTGKNPICIKAACMLAQCARK